MPKPDAFINPLSKQLCGLVSLSSILAVLFALASQHLFDMPPCAWCVFQRLLFIVIAILAGVAWASTHPRLTQIATILVGLTGLGGVASALYQINVASVAFSCAQTLADVIMTRSGLEAALPWLFGIYATCADASVKLLGIEYAIWALMLFALHILIAAIALRLSLRQAR